MRGAINAIDRISYGSSLRHVHPMEKFIFTMASMAVVIASECFSAPAAVFCVMTAAALVFTGIKLTSYLKLLMVPFVFVLLGVLSVIVEINSPIPDQIFVFKVFSFTAGISRSSVLGGACLFVKSFSSISCFYFFILSTPAVDFEFILRVMKVPVLFREMFMLVYRFIFIVAGMSYNIFLSQKLRLGYTSVRNSVRSFSNLASGVFVKSFVFGSRSYQALLSRGYDGNLNVSGLEYRLSPVNWFYMAVIELCFILIVIWLPL